LPAGSIGLLTIHADAVFDNLNVTTFENVCTTVQLSSSLSSALSNAKQNYNNFKIVYGSTNDYQSAAELAGYTQISAVATSSNTDENLISVGGPCENSVSSNLMGNPSACTAGLISGQAKVQVFNNGGNTQIVVNGYSAADTLMAVRAITRGNLDSIASSTALITQNPDSTYNIQSWRWKR